MIERESSKWVPAIPGGNRHGRTATTQCEPKLLTCKEIGLAEAGFGRPSLALESTEGAKCGY